MLHHSKFPFFALLALVCAAVSGCSSASHLSTDPQTSEDILRASTIHEAHVTLINGDVIPCYTVAVRKDSTSWRRDLVGWTFVPTDSVASISEDHRHISLINGSTIACNNATAGKQLTTFRPLGENVAVPTDSVYKIEIPNPQTGIGILIGVPVGGAAGVLVGAAIGSASFNQSPSVDGFFDALLLDPILGGLLGLVAGGIAGSAIGATNGTVWTNN